MFRTIAFSTDFFKKQIIMLEGKVKGISEETAEMISEAFRAVGTTANELSKTFEEITNSLDRIINAAIATKHIQLAIFEMKKSDSRFFKWYYQIKINKLKKQLGYDRTNLQHAEGLRSDGA